MQHYISNNLTKGGKLLSLFLYSTINEMKLTRIHPEYYMVDTTQGTNKERKDGNNFAFSACRGYILKGI